MRAYHELSMSDQRVLDSFLTIKADHAIFREVQRAIEQDDLIELKVLATRLRPVWLANCTPTTEAPPLTSPSTVANGAGETGKKVSTTRNEARTKIVGALLTHHRYQNGSVGNFEAIGVNELARLAKVGGKKHSGSSVTRFFKEVFGGHVAYRRACLDAGKLVVSLKTIAGDLRPREFLSGAQVPENPTPGQRRRTKPASLDG